MAARLQLVFASFLRQQQQQFLLLISQSRLIPLILVFNADSTPILIWTTVT
jgi:hypothetical protein